MTATANTGKRLTAWTTLIGGLLAFFTIAAMMVFSGGDLSIQFDPAAMLALNADAQRWFRIAMLADTFGFYLPLFVLGGYLWATLRNAGGVKVDMALSFLTLYVVCGVAGAVMQYATLPALAQMHLHADPAIRAASESAWLATVLASQKGLWWIEGPLMGFWAFVMGPLLRRQGWGFGRLLQGVGALYLLAFVGDVLGVPAPTLEPVAMLAVVLLPVWMLLIGSALLRGRGQ